MRDEPLCSPRRAWRAMRMWLWWMVVQESFSPSFWFQFRSYRRPLAHSASSGDHDTTRPDGGGGGCLTGESGPSGSPRSQRST